MHVCSVLTTPFPSHLFRSSVPCIIDPEHRDASVSVQCSLTRYSEFVLDLVKILTDVGKLEEIQIKICSAFSCLLARHLRRGT